MTDDAWRFRRVLVGCSWRGWATSESRVEVGGTARRRLRMGMVEVMSSRQPEDLLRDSAEQVHLFRVVADDRVEAVAKRAEYVSSRAAILITAAALTSTLGMPTSGNAWAVLAVLCTLAAAAAGVVAVFPTKADYPRLDELRAHFLEADAVEAELHHADEQVITYNDQVNKLHRRAQWVRFGFLLLGSSILFRTLLVLGISICRG
jgi:hypothetical protein